MAHPQTGSPAVATPQPPSLTPWHTLPAEAIRTALDAGPDGLPAAAAARLATAGPNTVHTQPPPGPLALLVAQFNSLIVWILCGAALVSGLLGEWLDLTAILAIVVLNALVGFYQEYQAGGAIAALQKLTSPQARVRRDGAIRLIPAAEVVPGDLIVLEAGDLVPADARLIVAASLRCVESALTGESEPADKRPDDLSEADLPLGDRVNMVYTGTSVATGTGQALVVATGMDTEVGHIAGLIEGAEQTTETPLQQRLEAFSKHLVWVSLGIVAVVFVLGWIRGLPTLALFLTAVSLAVAAIPEGLPAVTTVALAAGVQRMARRKALVRHLPAVENLGATSVICSDKTGTLTMGEMTVRVLAVADHALTITGLGYAPAGEILDGSSPPAGAVAEHVRDLLTILAVCNDAHLVEKDGAWTVSGDPTEGALLAAAVRGGLNLADVAATLPRVGEFPFDSDRKRMTVIATTSDGRRVFVKGAPDVMLPLCVSIRAEGGIRPLTDADREKIHAQVAAMGDQALRVLGGAWRDLTAADTVATPAAVEQGLVFAGLAGLYDPPRPEAKDAVARCQAAAIQTVMITGDHVQTALAVGRDLGMVTADSQAMTGQELDALDDAALKLRVAHITVYARVTAQHKLRIVRAWQANGGVVVMTGDGVNDAPAIRGADVGVAMGITGTEVTKAAADLIITDDNFATIVAAVEAGRGIYGNIRKTLQYLLSGNLAEVLVIAVAVMVGLPMPLVPIQLLWINLVTDGLPALAMATDPLEPGLMSEPPRSRTERLTDRS
ncbi:MAG: HAD-IC family P-type ATPase, partial [Candidatus Sericytochromatia bacterium]|nr:HAD-IC family P-type ATPase [Candidatus Sericytochromatia bacterium]